MKDKRDWPDDDRADDLEALAEQEGAFGEDVPAAVFLRRLARIALRRAREANKIVPRVERFEDWYNRLARLSVDVADALESRVPGDGPLYVRLSPPSRRERGRRLGKSELQQLEWRGVESLRIHRYPDGSAVVVVGVHEPFRLSRSLADLLEILAAPTERSPDGLVDYKPLRAIAVLLERDVKDRAQRHALQSLVNKLRARFRKAGLLDELYIHSDPKWGYRFALRQTAAKTATVPEVPYG